MSDVDFKQILIRLAAGDRLSEADSAGAFDVMMSGNATPSQMGAFLMALRLRGETVEEITGAARTMRAKALPITAPAGAIDTVGTGGDGAGTFNISTAAAIVVAGAGVPGRQTRQPQLLVEIGRGGHSASARRQSRCRRWRGAARDDRSQYRLSDGAEIS